MIPPVLHTERLTLRGLTAEDFPSFAAFYASDRASFVGGPLNEEQAWRALAAEIGHWTLRGYGRFAVEETATGKFTGVIGPWNPIGWPEPELGWDLMSGFEGKGYATEAALATRAYAYAELGWTTAISLVHDDNQGSAAVAKRMGAIWESKFVHERFGPVNIYRHPSADSDGNVEAYA